MGINLVRFSCVPLILLAAMVTNAATQALSPDGDSGEGGSNSWGLGVAGMATQQPYIGIDRDYMPIPVIFFENRWVQLIGATLEFKLPGMSWSEEHALSFGARVEFDGSGYKPGEAPILNGMAERKSGILAGAAARWDSPLLSVSAEAMIDASSNSKGRRFSVGLERTFFVGERVMVTPSLKAIQLDKRYAMYYFGVLPGEVRAGREAHAPGRTMNTAIGVQTDYMWGDHHVIFLQAEYTTLGNKIKSSPLVDRVGESMLILGYMFRF
jgi:outer membrane protein